MTENIVLEDAIDTEKDLPRILIISHTPFCSSDSMGSTLGAYFMEYPADRVAQFFIKPKVPDMPVCENYYCVTDGEVLHKVTHPFSGACGKAFRLGEVEPQQAAEATSSAERSMSGKHRGVGLLLRDLLWRTGVWKNKQFQKWLDDFDPQVVMVQPGDFSYIIQLAVEISTKRKIPLMIHQSEAYYLKHNLETSFVYRIYYRRFRKQFRKMMKRASHCVYLCDALERDYKACFDTPGSTIMKPTMLTPDDSARAFDPDKLTFVYAGNLGLAVGRCEPLLAVGKVLKSLGHAIDVYTASRGDHMRELTEENGIRLHAAVPYAELQKIIHGSDFLIHVENQSEWHRYDEKYAFSTKIADMLASGRCCIIHGSCDVAGIAYMRDNELAMVVEDENELSEKLRELLNDAGLREKLIQNALRQAEKYHNPKKNALAMNQTIENVWRQKP